MRHLLKSIFLSLIISTYVLASTTNDEVPKIPVKMGLQLFSHNNSTYLALNYSNHPKWHTYWKNPGDAGLPIKTTFKTTSGPIELQALEWPTPKRYIEPGDLWAYGYEGDYTLFYELKPEQLKKLNDKLIELKSTWLVCKHICVPGEKTISFKIAKNKLDIQNTVELSPFEEAELIQRLSKIPLKKDIPNNFQFSLHFGKAENSFLLKYEYLLNSDQNKFEKTNLLYAFPQAPFDFKHESLNFETGKITGYLPILWDGEYQTPVIDFPKNGKFKSPYTLKFILVDPENNNSLIIEKEFSEINTTPIELPKTTEPPVAKSEIVTVKEEPQSFLYYLVFAFIGGLILNIMPCVLPVISLKLFGLVKYQNQNRSQILKHNFFYTLGIVATFMLFALIILVLKSIGTQVGWGFQLQSPQFVSVMIVALFIFSLNLFGLFEFKTPGGRVLGNIETQSGFVGDFLSGVLATVLSTPCSAPFLGTALTFAFTSSTFVIFSVFIMIGLGLAFPFILTGFFPSTVSFLPKPGHWMNHVKKFLGLTLLLTVIWLFDVYLSLVGSNVHFIKLSTALVLITSAIIFYKKFFKLSILTSILSVILIIHLSVQEIAPQLSSDSDLLKEKNLSDLKWVPWSEEKLLELKGKQSLVFIDFTAKWCFTCKVNEKLVLETDEFKNLVKEKNIVLLLADWTRRDEVIAKYLNKHGLVGVPAYFIQKPDGTLINLGETITINKIKKYLD